MIENGLQNGCQVNFKTVTGDQTSTILQSHFLELVSIVIVIVNGRFNGKGPKMISSCDCPTVRLQLCRLIRAKYNSLCTNHIWGNCNCCNKLRKQLFFFVYTIILCYFPKYMKLKILLVYDISNPNQMITYITTTAQKHVMHVSEMLVDGRVSKHFLRYRSYSVEK